jgi:hypothetical protein
MKRLSESVKDNFCEARLAITYNLFDGIWNESKCDRRNMIILCNYRVSFVCQTVLTRMEIRDAHG